MACLSWNYTTYLWPVSKGERQEPSGLEHTEKNVGVKELSFFNKNAMFVNFMEAFKMKVQEWKPPFFLALFVVRKDKLNPILMTQLMILAISCWTESENWFVESFSKTNSDFCPLWQTRVIGWMAELAFLSIGLTIYVCKLQGATKVLQQLKFWVSLLFVNIGGIFFL
jgi:hypothetical protein